MLHQLSVERGDLARPLFAGLESHLAVAAAFAGETPAELFVDDVHAPRVGILLLQTRPIFVAGAPRDEAFPRAIAALLRERFAALTRDAGRVITYTPPSWEEHFATLFAESETARAERQYYRLQLRQPTPLPTPPEEFVLQKVDEALVAETSLANHQQLIAEMQSEAPSVAAFLRRQFGYCLQAGGELVGWCLSEYAHGDRCELGIETLRAFRRRGLATATALATLSHAHSAGIGTVGWHCWKENVASSALARTLGFELVEDYPVWRCRFGTRDGA